VGANVERVTTNALEALAAADNLGLLNGGERTRIAWIRRRRASGVGADHTRLVRAERALAGLA